MMEGRNTPAELRAPDHPPPWLDKESARRGRKLYFEVSAVTTIASIEALLMGMCVPNFYQPLVFSRESHGRDLAKQRYMDTAAIVYSWYLTDSWERESISSTNIRRVNAMHRYIAGKVRPIGLDKIGENVEEVFKEGGIDPEGDLSYQDKVFLDNVKGIRESLKFPQEFWDYVNDSTLFSKMDMTMVQGAFFALFALHPDKGGVGWVTKEQIQDFFHMWRVNGWYLGVAEENNAVLETVEETQYLAHLILEKILKPCMLHVSPQSLHMTKAALFPRMDYHVIAYAHYELIGYPLPKLWATFSIRQVIHYYLRKTHEYIYPLPGVRQTYNWLANNWTSNLLNEHKAKGSKAERKK